MLFLWDCLWWKLDNCWCSSFPEHYTLRWIFRCNHKKRREMRVQGVSSCFCHWKAVFCVVYWMRVSVVLLLRFTDLFRRLKGRRSYPVYVWFQVLNKMAQHLSVHPFRGNTHAHTHARTHAQRKLLETIQNHGFVGKKDCSCYWPGWTCPGIHTSSSLFLGAASRPLLSFSPRSFLCIHAVSRSDVNTSCKRLSQGWAILSEAQSKYAMIWSSMVLLFGFQFSECLPVLHSSFL